MKKFLHLAVLLSCLGIFFLGLISGNVLANGTEELGDPSIDIRPGGSGIVAAGTGLELQPGEIDIYVPGDVVQALLYWSGSSRRPEPVDHAIQVDGTEILGDLIGGPTSFDEEHDFFAYRADITDLGLVGQYGNTLEISGMDFTGGENNGAGILVIYDDGSGEADIQIRDGIDLAYFDHPDDDLQSTVPQTFDFDSADSEREATLCMFFGSVGSESPNANEITIDADGSGTLLLDELGSNDGDQWDTLNESISIPDGASELTVEAASPDPEGASFSWPVVALAIPPGAGCSLAVTKSCRVLTPPESDFVCSDAKPIDQLTMIWDGTQIIDVVAWKGQVGSTLLATIPDVGVGEEVTVSGYAGSPNDVIWELFDAVTDSKIGESVFHLSCSDADMNGPEDCGKRQGDGKDKTGFITDWLFEGMAGSGLNLDCNPTPPDPDSTCEIQTPEPPHCIGGVEVLSLRYVGGNCSETTNYQEGKVQCNGDAGMVEPVRIILSEKPGSEGYGKIFLDTGAASVYLNDIVNAVAAAGGEDKLKSDSYAEILDAADNSLMELKFHTSCSKPLVLGDRFGALEVVAMETREGGFVSLGAEVEYTYVIENTGGEDVFDVVVEDNHLGEIPGSPIDWIAPGESVVLATTAFVEDDTMNDVFVSGVTAQGLECIAIDSAMVFVLPPPPCTVSDVEFKIGDNKIEWKLFNTSLQKITIERIEVNWPDVLGNLKKIKLEKHTIFEQDVPPPSAVIDTFTGELKHRQIKAGDKRRLKFEFREKAQTSASDYGITVYFIEGCSVQLIP